MNILLTGASGFIGGAVERKLLSNSNISLSVALRRPRAEDSWSNAYVIDALSVDTNWKLALTGQDVVIHAAARAHVMDEVAINPLAEFRRVNVDGTLNLAKQAASAGVRRFIFISSIKVNGERTARGHSFTADDAPFPEDAYGQSKAEAEFGLKEIAVETGMELTIIRPPLVYGPGVKGNFSSLLRWVTRGVPLPLGAVTDNRRSLVALDNLVDLILTCVDHPKAANQTFLVSDGEDLSTADLLRRIGKSLNRPARLIPVPVSILIIASRLLGKSSIAQRILGSLQVDISKTCTLLNWNPPVSVDEGLRRAAQRS